MRRVPLRARKPLGRHAALKSTTRLARTAGLASFTPLCRYTALAPVSAKRAAENRLRREMAARRFPERPLCSVPWCPDWADDLHEVLTRARGGSITSEANTAPVCRDCHTQITDEAPWAYEVGLLRHSWDDEGGEAA